MQNKPIELYYFPTPNGWKISIMLEESNLPYNINWIDITKSEQFQPHFLKISPNNKIPTIVDPDGPDGKEISLFESGAILLYLGRKTGKFYSKDPFIQAEIEQWLMWQMGGLGPMAGQAHHFRLYAPEKIEYCIKRYTDEVTRLYSVINKRLADRSYLAGDYSIADIACIGWISLYEGQGQDLKDYPYLEDWYNRISSRPAVQKGLAIGKEIRATQIKK